MMLDPEIRLFKAMADMQRQIQQLQKDLNSLKTRFTNIELAGFQVKINNLEKIIKKQKEDVLVTQRFLAKVFITQRVTAFNDILETQKYRVAFDKLNNIKSRIISDAAAATTATDRAEDPLLVAKKFHTKIVDYLKEQGLDES
jgi:hypothetical protein